MAREVRHQTANNTMRTGKMRRVMSGARSMDCFVALLLAMTGDELVQLSIHVIASVAKQSMAVTERCVALRYHAFLRAKNALNAATASLERIRSPNRWLS